MRETESPDDPQHRVIEEEPELESPQVELDESIESIESNEYIEDIAIVDEQHNQKGRE